MRGEGELASGGLVVSTISNSVRVFGRRPAGLLDINGGGSRGTGGGSDAPADMRHSPPSLCQ
jgi:hypothetical protein